MPSETVAQCSKTYGGALEKQGARETAEKTSTTNIDSNIETFGTDASWYNKVEDEQKTNKEADGAHSADGGAWNKHVQLSRGASPDTNLATHDK